MKHDVDECQRPDVGKSTEFESIIFAAVFQRLTSKTAVTDTYFKKQLTSNLPFCFTISFINLISINNCSYGCDSSNYRSKIQWLTCMTTLL